MLPVGPELVEVDAQIAVVELALLGRLLAKELFKVRISRQVVLAEGVKWAQHFAHLGVELLSSLLVLEPLAVWGVGNDYPVFKLSRKVLYGNLLEADVLQDPGIVGVELGYFQDGLVDVAGLNGGFAWLDQALGLLHHFRVQLLVKPVKAVKSKLAPGARGNVLGNHGRFNRQGAGPAHWINEGVGPIERGELDQGSGKVFF